ncbi:hypothetical protein FHX75_121487 [Micromonospora palomenae]|uniref:Uncharacterized protein n=1 Tax=Micromonospora palomenae TaxID=1461247 RepID=A0A561WGF0_9ACTN|nr:hypothetical protein FHX75_121487 [Micromonospora palomenae]
MQPPAGSQVSRVPAQRTPPDQLAPPAAPPAPQQQPRRTRTVLTVVAGVLALLCVSGAVIGYVLYDRATAPDRSAPDVVVVNYLQAVLVARDDSKANLFTCGGPLPAVDEFRDRMAAREQQLDTVFSVNIENVAVTKTGDKSAVVNAVIRRSATIDGVQQSLTDTWRFEVADQQEGWRVCSAASA